VPGNTYVLEFWAGGEQYLGSWDGKGLFAVDVGFGDTLLRCPATPNNGGIGTRYIIEFNAIAASHTIKFTNWGHIRYNCTELVLDDVRLYTVAELSPDVPACIGSSSQNSFAASDTLLCEKFCINFFDSSSNNPTAWQWIFPGGTPSSSTDQNPTSICYQIPGIYDVTLITTNANGSDTLTLQNYITVYATPPFPTITQVGYTLTSSPASSYQWQLNSVDIAGATNQSYTILQTGYYTVVVSDSNGCVNSLTVYILISGINDVITDGSISIYPNPSSGDFIVEFSYANLVSNETENGWLNGLAVGETDEVSIDVMNTVGQLIFSSIESRSPGTSSFKTEINLSDAASGIYFLRIKTPNTFVYKKIIVEK
jgi:PKD repeat protein